MNVFRRAFCYCNIVSISVTVNLYNYQLDTHIYIYIYTKSVCIPSKVYRVVNYNELIIQNTQNLNCFAIEEARMWKED